jgi:hypothetical protein
MYFDAQMFAIKSALLLYSLLATETKMHATSAFDCTSTVAPLFSFRRNQSLLIPSRFRTESYSYFNHELGRNSLNFFRQKEWQLISLRLSNSDEDRKRALLEEDTKMKVWASRRTYIRNVLRFAESVKYYRISNGFFDVSGDDITDDEKRNADRKAALAITAFIAAAGAVALRVGGRAALISGLGIDFANDNPELKNQIDSFLSYVHDSGPSGPLLFILAWTAVKVFCFDAGGVVLAVASGVMESRSIEVCFTILIFIVFSVLTMHMVFIFLLCSLEGYYRALCSQHLRLQLVPQWHSLWLSWIRRCAKKH